MVVVGARTEEAPHLQSHGAALSEEGGGGVAGVANAGHAPLEPGLARLDLPARVAQG